MDVETKLGRALHRAGLTTYDYATAEILRLLRCLAEEGLEVGASDNETRPAPDYGPGGYVIPRSFMDPDTETGIPRWDEWVRPLLRREPPATP